MPSSTNILHPLTSSSLSTNVFNNTYPLTVTVNPSTGDFHPLIEFLSTCVDFENSQFAHLTEPTIDVDEQISATLLGMREGNETILSVGLFCVHAKGDDDNSCGSRIRKNLFKLINNFLF